MRDAYDWYENQLPGLGLEFAKDFFSRYRHLVRDAQLGAGHFSSDEARDLGAPPRFAGGWSAATP